MRKQLLYLQMCSFQATSFVHLITNPLLPVASTHHHHHHSNKVCKKSMLPISVGLVSFFFLILFGYQKINEDYIFFDTNRVWVLGSICVFDIAWVYMYHEWGELEADERLEFEKRSIQNQDLKEIFG